MGDIRLSHSRKGYVKPHHKYYKRELRDGKWVYYYKYKDYVKDKAITGQQDLKLSKGLTKMADDHEKDLIKTYNGPAANNPFREEYKKNVYSKQINPLRKKAKKYADSAYRAERDRARAVQSHPLYKASLKYGAIKSKTIRNIRRGKKKVSELLNRLKAKRKKK